jgi:spermidine synthase
MEAVEGERKQATILFVGLNPWPTSADKPSYRPIKSFRPVPLIGRSNPPPKEPAAMKRTALPLSPTAFFTLFAISGFAGLIYESIWTHYIKLFLGHAAYAQTLVLAIFMGGMAGGAWLASRRSHRWRNPLVTYAIVEGAIGLAAVVFHRVFVAATDASYEHIIPALGSPAAAQAWKWTLSALLILPQSVLLGMTFPLMSGGILRRWPSTPGRSLAMLYFTNSIGGAIGVLVSGFYFIGTFGLPGTIMTAGLINIMLALVVWLLTRSQAPAAPIATDTAGEPQADRWMRWMLAAAAVTGAASFVYEIAWIRMLSLVLGSSTHAFELMLSAFILGLALGGLWIKRRIELIADPVRSLGYIQVVMGLLALATLPLYSMSFDIMHAALSALSRTESAYQGFNLISHFICLLVMLPATFCAGMTLPLITFVLIKRGHGEKSIGAVYSANTMGGIAGVVLAVNLLMPLVGTKGLIAIGAVLDLGLGIVLLKDALAGRRLQFAAVSGSAAVVFGLVLTFAQLDVLKLSSGVYRGNPASWPKNTLMLHYRDGKTATVALIQAADGGVTLSTNGKPDAKINMGSGSKASPDEPTMVLVGALALAANPKAKTAANIGMGSGLTAHTLLSTPQLERLDIIEIEAEMVKAARGYSERVHNTFNDPRSHINIEDAKVFFSTRRSAYDVIISEPSNPWVSGVASLFSQEFYKHVNQHLTDDGVFAQWVQLYEVDLNVVASIMKAVSSQFSDYTVISLTDFDILILARKQGQFGSLSADILSEPGLAKNFERIGVQRPQDIQARWLGNKRTLDPMFQSFGAPVNSDYFPFVDQNAVRTRFMNIGGLDLTWLAMNSMPLLEMITPTHANHGALTGTVAFARAKADAAARTLRTAIIERRYGDAPEIATASMLLPHLFVEACDTAAAEELWIEGLIELAALIVPQSTPHDLEPVWARMADAKCFLRRSPKQKQWFALVRALSNRDAAGMIDISEKILASEKNFEPSHRMQYALRAAILGNLVAGRRGNANQLWQAYGVFAFRTGEPTLDVRLMLTLDEPEAYQAWRSLFASHTPVVASRGP